MQTSAGLPPCGQALVCSVFIQSSINFRTMKRIIILLSLFGLLPAGLHAEAVGLEQARQKAVQVLGTSQAMAVDGLTTATRAGDVEPAYYLFTAPQGGYAIITGEDSFPDVVAYSLRGKLVEGRQLPPAMQWLLDLYAQCVEAVRTGEADAPEKLPATRASVPVVEPLVPTSWGQDAPYRSEEHTSELQSH